MKDELLAELEEMEQEELDKNLLEVEGPSSDPLPNVPSTSLPARPGMVGLSEPTLQSSWECPGGLSPLDSSPSAEAQYSRLPCRGHHSLSLPSLFNLWANVAVKRPAGAPSGSSSFEGWSPEGVCLGPR